MAFCVTVTFRLRPGRMADFLPLVRANAGASVRDEPGCRRFDVCLPEGAADEVFLYELYDSAAAFEAHLASPHYAAFDAATRAMVAAKAARRLAAEEHA